jgi:hypothetical protein
MQCHGLNKKLCMLFINKYSIYVCIGKIPGTTNGQQPKIKSSGMDVPKQQKMHVNPNDQVWYSNHIDLN